jgi:predicted adenine nucleotide alpha hydrolase (AANH) superfamily ATPase
MRVLLHICCGPCAIVPIRALRDEGHEVEAAFLNPNIHPYREYEKRLEAAREVVEAFDVPMPSIDEYGLTQFLRAVVESEDDRCRICYALRLDRAAEVAVEGGFDAFTTTMLVSTQQDHDAIRRAGVAAAAKHGIEFLARDWRDRVMDGVRESKAMGHYRQQYCGCIYSEWERYRPKRSDAA